MPDPSIHSDHAERIERECAQARKRARATIAARITSTIDFWDKEEAAAVERSSQAYGQESARLHTLMLAALVADGDVS